MKSRAAGAIQVLALLAAVFLALGMCGRAFWIFDLLSHFRWQYAATFLLCGPALFFLGRRRSGLASLAAAALLFWHLASPVPAVPSVARPTLKILSFNVLRTNPQQDRICSFLEQENADVVVLTEITTGWKDGIKRLSHTYPYFLSSSSQKPRDVIILSKYPFVSGDMKDFRKRRWGEVEIMVNGENLRIIAAHTTAPVNAAMSRKRNEQLLALGACALGASRTLLCGDLNTTPFSPWFRSLLSASGLQDSSLGAGYSPTWMCAIPPLAVPIDHVLLSHDLALVSRRVGPSLGSDHSPLIVEVAFAKNPALASVP